jgi:hypothetical protein
MYFILVNCRAVECQGCLPAVSLGKLNFVLNQCKYKPDKIIWESSISSVLVSSASSSLFKGIFLSFCYPLKFST